MPREREAASYPGMFSKSAHTAPCEAFTLEQMGDSNTNEKPSLSTRRSMGPVIVRRATDFDAIISTCTNKLEANPRLLRALMLRAQAHLRKGESEPGQWVGINCNHGFTFEN